MAMNFRDLDDLTRGYMLSEFDAEQSGANPFRSRGLSVGGIHTFSDLIREAISHGNEETLALRFNNWGYWNTMESYTLKGVTRERKVNLAQTSERLALTEFNTWYVRGFAKRLLDEQVITCEVYRAAEPKWAVAGCTAHEGRTFLVQDVYNGHRATYWPEPGNPTALTIPFGYGCHYTIGRTTHAALATSGA
jgi:hypothetical protein